VLKSVSASDLPAKGCRPLSISYNTAPKLKMSERRSGRLPLSCSGKCTRRAGHFASCRINAPRNAEVHHLDAVVITALRQQNVFRFDVAVNESLGVRLSQSESNLARDRFDCLGWCGSCCAYRKLDLASGKRFGAVETQSARAPEQPRRAQTVRSATAL